MVLEIYTYVLDTFPLKSTLCLWDSCRRKALRRARQRVENSTTRHLMLNLLAIEKLLHIRRSSLAGAVEVVVGQFQRDALVQAVVADLQQQVARLAEAELSSRRL